jgi:hypothetical protein
MDYTPGRGYPFPTVADETDVPNDMEKLALAVDRDVTELTYDSSWMDVEFVNNFGVGYEGARYRRKADVVYLQIMASRDAAWPSETVLFRLPVGFRPKYSFWMLANNGGQTVEVRIMSNGDVRLITPSRPEFGGVLVFSGPFPLN